MKKSIPCLLCQRDLLLHLSSLFNAESQQRFDILSCEQCGLQQTWPVPRDLPVYYPDQYYENRHSFTKLLCAKRRLRWVDKFVHPNRTVRKILDIGSGDGTFLFLANRLGWQGYGIEIHPNVNKVKEVNIVSDLSYFRERESFDAITLWHSLEHMVEISQTLSQAHQLLKADGKLFVAVPNAFGWQAKIFKKYWLHRDVPRHIYHFSFKSLSKMLAKNGFQVIETYHQEFEYDLMGWVQSFLNMFFQEQNILFHVLTGKKIGVNKLIIYLNLLIGSIFTILFLPLLPFSVWAKAGGTLVVVADKYPQREPDVRNNDAYRNSFRVGY